MNVADKPCVTVVHSIPGRVRVRLSHVLKDPQRLRFNLLEHEGVVSVAYTPRSGSVLVRFEGGHVTREEVILRIALLLALDYGATPVRLLTRPEVPVMGGSATYSGLLIAAALAGRLFARRSTSATMLERLAGAGTAAAVFEHGWREAKLRGYIDPEVLTLGYLLTSFMRGNYLAAAIITWVSTFGRHLIEPVPQGVEVQPLQVGGDGEKGPRYEVFVRPDMDAADGTRFFNLIRGVVKYTMGGEAPTGHLLDDLRRVSQIHGEVLEGYGKWRHGIPMRFD